MNWLLVIRGAMVWAVAAGAASSQMLFFAAAVGASMVAGLGVAFVGVSFGQALWA
ncbi:hypothetical protein [Streptomyces sp. NPDC001450]